MLPLFSFEESERLFEIEEHDLFKHKIILPNGISESFRIRPCASEICNCQDKFYIGSRTAGAIVRVNYNSGVIKFVYHYVGSLYYAFSYRDGICIRQFVTTIKNVAHNVGPAVIRYYENGNIESIAYYNNGKKINMPVGGVHRVTYLYNGEVNEMLQVDGTIVSNDTVFRDLWLQHCITPITMHFAD